MSNTTTNTLSFTVTGLFSLKNGRTEHGSHGFNYHIYDTLILGLRETYWPAELKMYAGGHGDPMPDDSVVFATGQVRWPPAVWPPSADGEATRPDFPRRAYIDCQRSARFDGDPSSDAYDIVPIVFTNIAIVGHVRSSLLKIDDDLEGFRVSTSTYIGGNSGGVVQQELHCAFDRSNPRWKKAPAPNPNSCVHVIGLLQFVHTDGTPGISIDHISYGLSSSTPPPSQPPSSGRPSKKRKLLNTLPWEDDTRSTAGPSTPASSRTAATTTGSRSAATATTAPRTPPTPVTPTPAPTSLHTSAAVPSLASQMLAQPQAPAQPSISTPRHGSLGSTFDHGFFARPPVRHPEPSPFTSMQETGHFSLPAVDFGDRRGMEIDPAYPVAGVNAAVAYNPLQPMEAPPVAQGLAQPPRLNASGIRTPAGVGRPASQPANGITLPPLPLVENSTLPPLQLPSLPPIHFPQVPGDMPNASAKAKGKRPQRGAGHRA